ncbi:hypothetical protein KP509_13G012000 [Ceratopteris richardii]|uniref:Uncharacterized protein n=1 Tax=Ceratopteris richardii TaxID=49495 RepID=A0A8T2TIS3_CERRI|nr:hypothetical protein KP509_13G012000 [Ceratopteris richardii]KAH7420551.1 hypothetical protein KP509_13G012000 [Ceratopteris richardii]
MTINVSVLSHAFFTEKGIFRALQYPCGGVPNNNRSEQQTIMKIDGVDCECMPSQDISSMVSISQTETAGSYASRDTLMSPRSTMASPSPRTIAGASPSPRLMATGNPSPRSGSGKSQGKKKNHKKRGGRRRGADSGIEPKEPKTMEMGSVSTAKRDRGTHLSSCIVCGNRIFGGADSSSGPSGAHAAADVYGGEGVHMMEYVVDGTYGSNNELPDSAVDVMVHKVRKECSSALGIVEDDLQLFGLCHIPSSVQRVTLLKDKAGVVHIGVMVHNSDLNLQNIEELVVNKDKAEQEAESYRVQVGAKSKDFNNLKLKYDKLTEEVLRLRTMVNRANHLRRESEKATEVLRVEFEKLVKTLFMECSSQPYDKVDPSNQQKECLGR